MFSDEGEYCLRLVSLQPCRASLIAAQAAGTKLLS